MDPGLAEIHPSLEDLDCPTCHQAKPRAVYTVQIICRARLGPQAQWTLVIQNFNVCVGLKKIR